jgi:chemotaxis signal transduction protein
MVVFTVGGRRLAAKANDVGGIWPWTEADHVPSGTPFVSAVLRRGQDILPVYDLAAKLGVRVEGDDKLCMIAKHPDGPMAVCIDGHMPTLHLVDPASVRPVTGGSAVEAMCQIAGQDIPVYALGRLTA